MRRYWLLLAQAAVMAAVTAVSAVGPYLLYGAMDSGDIAALSGWLQWILVPLCAAGTAYFLVRRRLNRYLGWIVPPVVYAGLPWLVTGYPPRAGVMLACCLTGVVGAAAGEVKNQMDTEKR